MTGRHSLVDYVGSNRLARHAAQRGGGFRIDGEEGLERQFRKGDVYSSAEHRGGREKTQKSPFGFELKWNENVSMSIARRRRIRFRRWIAAQLLEQRQQRAIIGQGDLAK